MSPHPKKWAWLGLSTDSVGNFVIILSNSTVSTAYIKWIKNDQSVISMLRLRNRYSPALPAMPQVDGSVRQMNGLRVRHQLQDFRVAKICALRSRSAGLGEAVRLVGKAQGLERKENER